MTNFWDDDGNFNYEAHFEAGEREKAAATAERIGYPGMTDAFYRFGLYGDIDDAVSLHNCWQPWTNGRSCSKRPNSPTTTWTTRRWSASTKPPTAPSTT